MTFAWAHPDRVLWIQDRLTYKLALPKPFHYSIILSDPATRGNSDLVTPKGRHNQRSNHTLTKPYIMKFFTCWTLFLSNTLLIAFTECNELPCKFAWGCNGRSAGVYVDEKVIRSSFNTVWKMQKNILTWIINIPLWAHEMNLSMMSVLLMKNISNQDLLSTSWRKIMITVFLMTKIKEITFSYKLPKFSA